MCTWEQEYVELIGAFPRLSNTWFAPKIERAKAGDEDARILIVGASLWVAWETAGEFKDFASLSLPELTQQANLAVLNAVESYLGEDAESFEAHLKATIRDRLLKLVLRRPAMVA